MAPRNTLLEQIDQSIDCFAQVRTADPMSVAAFDTLKQARALIAQALVQEQQLSLRRAAGATSPSVAGVR